MEQRWMRLVNLIEYFDSYTFIPLLQYFQSVYQDGLCTGIRGFGSEALKQIKV